MEQSYNNYNKYNVIKNIAYTVLSILVFILICYIIIYSVLYIYTPCDTEKKYNLNISNICKINKYPEKSQSFIEREIIREKEVFHIKNQNLTFEQAKEKCKAYNSKLATKNQITKSYNKGANWCTYGWSANQEAYYPVQKCLHKSDCGDPGINGGYFEEKNIKFGANCFGVKPPNKNIEEKSIYCNDKAFCDQNTNKESCSKSKDDFITPFNKDKWSMY